MPHGVTLVGMSDGQILESLREAGIAVNPISMAELSALTQRPAAPIGILVVDVRGETHMAPAIVAFRRQHGAVPIVIVASTLDPNLMLEAMRAGVNECVAEPFGSGELITAVNRLLAQRPGQPGVGKVFTFLGAKGGVGTTTTAVNVATELSKMAPSATLFVDLHFAHGDSSVFLGVEPRFSVLDAIENIHRLDEAFLRTLVVRTRSGPDLLASSDRVLTMPIDAARIRALIDFVARHYRFIVLDVPRSEASVLDALESSDRIIVVANQELATVRSAGRIAEALRQRYGRDRISVAVSRYDPQCEIGQTDVERAVGGPVRHLFPSDYRQALQALNSGRPLTLGNHTNLAGAFRTLAQDLAGLRRPESPPKTTSFLGGLIRRS